MKLHKLTLKNINSLLGTWQIDFDDETYRQNGIFGIVGNTGAGKTTLLDAICLAIYRETPRLGKITKNQNALISTDTTECQAQVELSLTRNNQTQRYIFLFSQARATRGKSKGELQEPTHEILLQNNTGEFKPISEKKSETDKLAVELLGMNFTQFTRSVLLAQGGFSAFLQANSEERGQILEKITGTEIYASIGKKTYEKHKTQKQQIEDKKSKLTNIISMSDDEIFSLKTAIENTNSIKLLLNQKLGELDYKIKQKNQYNQLKKSVNDYQNKLNEINQQWLDFQPNIIKLNHAKNYNFLLPIFNHLTSLENKKIELENQNTQLRTQLNNEKLAREIIQNQLIISQENFDKHNEIYQKWQPKLLTLKQLDNELNILSNTSKFTQTTLIAHQNNKTELTQKLNKIHQTIAQLSKDIENNRKFLTIHRSIDTINADTLSTNLVNFTHHLEKILNKVNELDKKQHKITNLRQQNQDTKTILCQYCQDNKDTAIQSYLYGLDNELTHARTNLSDIDIFINHFNELLEKKEIHQQKQNQLKKSQDEFKIREIEIKSQEITRQHLNNEYALLEKNYRLLDEIHRLTEFIDTLQDDMPCPLCGSTHHPYAKNPPKHDEINVLQQNLIQKKSALADFENTYKNLELHLRELKASIYHQEQQSIELNSNIDKNQKNLKDDWQRLSVHLNSRVMFDELTHDLLIKVKNEFIDKNKNKKETYEIVKDLFEHAKNNKQKYQELYQEWQHDKDEIGLMLNQLNGVQNQLSNSINNHYDLVCQFLNNHQDTNKHGIDAVFNGITQLNELYQQDLNKDSLIQFYQIAHHLMDDLDNFKEKANAIKNEFLSAIHNYQKKDNEYKQQQTNLGHYQTNKNNYETELKSNEQTSNELQLELTKLQHKIHDLSAKKLQEFGNIDADSKEKELLNHWQNAKDELNAAKENLALIDQRVCDLIDRLDENQIQLQKNNEELLKINETFNKELSQKFIDFHEFLNAKMNDEELQQFENQYNFLTDNKKQIELHLTQTQNQLKTLIDDTINVKEDSIEELTSKYQQTKTELENLLTDFGTNQVKYEQAIENQQKKLQLMGEIEELEQAFLPLQQLNELIGSSDGKKYRNFAQSLTLTALLNEANIELSKINKRYLLTASTDDKSILGIDVIDTYQDNSIRQSKNLSGGESFVVSLALALGLSKMSSQKMQIDSLFLDEGFGTLDEEALEMALDALSEIWSDGKMIGIISHIGALKERLHTKITVEKKSGGVSGLIGAGVTKLG